MAMSFAGIENVGDFYSQHYLEALLADDLKGLLQRWGDLEDKGTTPPDKALRALKKQFLETRQRLMRSKRVDHKALLEDTRAWHDALLQALGYPAVSARALPVAVEDKVHARVSHTFTRDGQPQLMVVEAPFVHQTEGSLLDVAPLAPDPLDVPEGEQTFAGSVEELIDALFVIPKPPRWILALAGREVLLAERSRWGQARYLRFTLDAVMDGAEAETFRVTAALLCRDALSPEEGPVLHDVLDESSHKHAYGVSEDLKYNLREAVELLGNAWVEHQRASKQKVFGKSDANLFGDEQARQLTNECLTFLYRLLFIFYAEARGDELGILPMKSEAYRLGYSLEHLRDLEMVRLHGPHSRDGTFIHDSLQRLFDMIHNGVGHTDAEKQKDIEQAHDAFEIRPLHSALFDRERTKLLSGARFPNHVMQQVLELLSLSKRRTGRKATRGRISYARLGINQLGAVYEGLLSYTGFFAQETLYELKKDGAKDDADALDQIYFAKEADLKQFKASEFAMEEDPDVPDGPLRRKKYLKGSFVYRLAGRDRERSASYYTPEVLTKAVVKYALKELLKGKSADDILKLTICEPAMGSGAFLNEAIGQLADAYLERKQLELGTSIPQSDYAKERQRVKAFIATHNAYGVDLNPVATELAKISMWLNIVGPDTAVPWFDLRLGVGNSLIGCGRLAFSANDVAGKSGGAPRYLEAEPRRVPWNEKAAGDLVWHFLLPSNGMAAFQSSKVLAELAPEEVAVGRDWLRTFVRAPWTEGDVVALKEISRAAAALWTVHVESIEAAKTQCDDVGGVWPEVSRLSGRPATLETKEATHSRLYAGTSAGARLKLAMDAWCALWAWPVHEARLLPSRQEWLETMGALLAGDHDTARVQRSLFPREVSAAEERRAESGAVDVEDVVAATPWIGSVVRTAREARNFHWELFFGDVFLRHGGFHLLVGNPPWLKLEWNEGAYLSDSAPDIALRELSAPEVASRRTEMLGSKQARTGYLNEASLTLGAQAFLGAASPYHVLEGVQANLYKNFLVLGWHVGVAGGVAALLHQPAVFDDPKGGLLRREGIARLRLLANFKNELQLFAIDNQRPYCFTVWGEKLDSPKGEAVCNLFHPRTIDDCYLSAGHGPVPGIKTAEGTWDLRGHRSRIIQINQRALETFSKLYDAPGTPWQEARLPVVHSQEMLRVLERFADAPRIGDQKDWYPTEMWHETNQQKDGTILAKEKECNKPEEWIVSGPHFYVARPFFKTPNPGRKNNRDYTELDLTTLPEDYLPRTMYVPGVPPREYLARTPTLDGEPVTKFYRHVHRRRLAVTGERTLISAIVPPGVGHIDQVTSVAFKSLTRLVDVAGVTCSLVGDYFVRSTGKGDLRGADFGQIPMPTVTEPPLRTRVLRLNCLTAHYADLWESVWTPGIHDHPWTKDDHRLKWPKLTKTWTYQSALRTDYERRQALVELDALAALGLGIDVDELCAIYRIQFPVLQGYERADRFDQRGALVPGAVLKAVLATRQADGKVTDPETDRVYHLPFDGCDREEDMRRAYKAFAKEPRGAKS